MGVAPTGHRTRPLAPARHAGAPGAGRPRSAVPGDASRHAGAGVRGGGDFCPAGPRPWRWKRCAVGPGAAGRWPPPAGWRARAGRVLAPGLAPACAPDRCVRSRLAAGPAHPAQPGCGPALAGGASPRAGPGRLAARGGHARPGAGRARRHSPLNNDASEIPMTPASHPILKPYALLVRGLDALQPLAALLARLYVAQVFFLSGLPTLRDWDITLALFQDEYHVPVLLVLGLGGRIPALGLLVVNTMAVLSLSEISSEALQGHVFWGSLLAALAVHGSGCWTLDTLCARWLRR